MGPETLLQWPWPEGKPGLSNPVASNAFLMNLGFRHQFEISDKYLMGHKIMVLGIICRCTGRVNSRLIFRTKKFILAVLLAGFVSLRVYPVWQIVTNTPRYLVSCGFVFILSKAHTLDDLWWHPDQFTCSHCSHCSLQVCVLYIVFTSELQCIIIKHHYHKQFQFCILYLPECLN